MPLYYLYTWQSSAWTYSGYQLSIAGNANAQMIVMDRTTPKQPPPPPGQWNTITGPTRSGNGNPNAPANGDTLGLPATIGTLTNIEGSATYNSTGDSTLGAGYYTNHGPTGDDGDWCAATN